MINEQIRDKEVRLIGNDGEQLGIVQSKEAQRLADESKLDLVKIAPTVLIWPKKKKRPKRNRRLLILKN